ncbi:MAG: RHS repeat-associated core domain-containing protein [Haliscomenobacter sp.]|nr:RHS repeat-associated core domain-containing protein [Haliscomenobacter sp.]
MGNTARVAQFNFRTLSPQQMRDANLNFSEVLTDELGLVKAMALLGKGTEADDLNGLSEATEAAERTAVLDFFASPDSVTLTTRSKDLLQHATARFVYDFDVYRNTGKPAVVAAIMREEHFQKNNNSPVQLSFEYSNGLGQVVMKKVQAEPGLAKKVILNPADDSYIVTDEDTSALSPPQLRWIGNGRTVLNNKGNAVKQYEPYFSVTHQYEDLKELVETGVTPLLYYDAPGRLVRTEMPDGTLTRVEFDSWKQATYDQNDTVLESEWYRLRTNRRIDAELTAALKDPVREKVAADKAALHANTPTVQHFDTLGRPVLSVEHNKNLGSGADEFYLTIIHLDIEGNALAVVDARQKARQIALGLPEPVAVMRYEYDMLGHRVYQNSMDAGQRWLLTNLMGKPLRTWDERGHEFRYAYDPLHRPTESRVLGGDNAIALDHIFEKIIYGEEQTNDQNRNLRGQVYRHYDTGGRLEMPDYDFKGQPNSTSRRLFSKYKEVANWTGANVAADLEAQDFVFQTETDALGRISRQVAPDGSVIVPAYNAGGLLKAESVTHLSPAVTTIYIRNIDYNEKGQRERIHYGNNVTTRFHYDRETFRLTRLVSRRQNGDLLQDLRYTYDPTGNITQIEDLAIPTTFFANFRTDGLSEYTYDALYRLVEATGRENSAALNFGACDNWNDKPFMHSMNPGDPMAVRNYTQRYQYDAVGNIMEMRHLAVGGNWTRTYEYETTNNRLKSTRIGDNGSPANYTQYQHHAAHGCMEELPHLEKIGWNFKEEVVMTTRQRCTDDNIPVITYYQYDSAGQRIRKITETEAAVGGTPTKKEERIYIAGYELYKKYTGAHAGLERVSLSLMDEGHRFVMIDTRNAMDDGTAPHLVRYQLHNHLGSAALELDNSADAAMISYEEYHPFGTTAYQAQNASIQAAAKRYRYTGMERDEETGLEYHSARYYLPWLGRWLSGDPIGIGDGMNVYAYGRGNPMRNFDTTGLQSNQDVNERIVEYLDNFDENPLEGESGRIKHCVVFFLTYQ